MTRIDDELAVSSSNTNEDYIFSAHQVIAALQGSASSRTLMPATYWTPSLSPTVHFTALASDGVTVLTSRRTSGVTLVGIGMYRYQQPCAGVSEFFAVWDEGNVSQYVLDYVVVDH